jgi:hypothetical protein
MIHQKNAQCRTNSSKLLCTAIKVLNIEKLSMIHIFVTKYSYFLTFQLPVSSQFVIIDPRLLKEAGDLGI